MFIKMLKEGESLWIAGVRLQLEAICREGVAVLLVAETELVEVQWDRRIEVLPEVFMSTDRESGHGTYTKLLITAPKRIKIRGAPDEPQPKCDNCERCCGKTSAAMRL